jgi:CheY-like chemotaxis protein
LFNKIDYTDIMINKRALVVDDSRSARLVLSRALEGFGITVDAVESAEIALDYLNASKPDVIFMDHLLTGMDGLAAVRIIKANPATRNIPVFMYSSQHETAFIHASRIAGALGVISKTFKPGDVAQALQQVRFAATRVEQTPAPITKTSRAQWIALIILGVSLVFCITALMYSNHRLQAQLTRTQQVLASATSSAASVGLTIPKITEAVSGNVVALDSETVPYGEVPLAGSRLERLKSMINALTAKSFKGVLRVEVFTGDYCLQGSQDEGFHVAPAELSIQQCDLLGNPFADLLSVQQRQSAAFTSYLATLNQSGAIRIQLADGGRQLATPYPPHLPEIKAGEWNLSAARNNRVQFTATAIE